MAVPVKTSPQARPKMEEVESEGEEADLALEPL